MSAIVTENQKNLIRALLAERDVPQFERDELFAQAKAGMSWHTARAWIPVLKAYPFKQGTKPVRQEIPPVGIYELSGQIYAIREFTNDKGDRIRYARQAQAVDKDGIDVAIDSPAAHRVDFIKAPGVQYRLADGRRLELAEIEALSLQFSTCFVCGRTLKVNESKKAGIGPVCRKRIG